MRGIITHQPQHEVLLNKYVIKEIGHHTKLINVEEKQLAEVKDCVDYFEVDFKMQLGTYQWQDIELLLNENILFVTIGDRQLHKKVRDYYNLNQRTWENDMPLPSSDFMWVSCYGQGFLLASELIDGVSTLAQLANKLNKQLIIFGDWRTEEVYYQYRSLTYKMIDEILIHHGAILFQRVTRKEYPYYHIPCSRAFEPYTCHFMLSNGSDKKLLKDVLRKLKEKRSQRNAIQPMLYNDLFYQLIPKEQPIYVPLRTMWPDEIQKCKDLGLNIVAISGLQSVLYNTKQEIDELSNEIKNYVMPNYTMPIVSPCEVNKFTNTAKRQPINRQLNYTGKNVYIGMVNVSGVDYTHEALRSDEGSTRMACIWKQTRGEEGYYITAAKINENIINRQKRPEDCFSEEEKRYSQLLAIAGGTSKASFEMASEAEFLIAQVKSAPQVLQQLYGGTPHAYSALLADVLIGASKLIELAALNQKPLVLYLPFVLNLSAHDGSDIYEQLLEYLARQPGCTIVVPTGEEGNKKHHQMLKEQEEQQILNLTINQESQNVIGALFMKSLEEPRITLCSLAKEDPSVEVGEKGIYKLLDVIIYSNGIENNFSNGGQKFIFRIENSMTGTWRFTIKGRTESNTQIDLWLSQTSLNPHAYLGPCTPRGTINALGNLKSIISVGGFEEGNEAIWGASGRGDIEEQVQMPNCVMEARSFNQQLEGTGVAAAYMVGLLACLYDKWQMERGYPYATSKMMWEHLLAHVNRGDLQSYPNWSEGYGAITQSEFLNILLKPFQ